MAASLSKSLTLSTKVLLSTLGVRQQIAPTLSPVFQVRHRNKKQRVKDAKVDVDKKNSYISKKDRKRATVNVSEQEKSTILAAKPLDNVWVHKFYPVQHFSIQEALLRHKAFAQPAMLDNMRGLFYLSMRLDLTTKKKTKFMGTVRTTVRLPHEFPFGSPPAILVLSKEPEKMNLATSLGAKQVGTPEEVLKMITTGVLKATDFKHVLCTTDCGTEILPLRNYLRDTFPQKAKGTLGSDLQAMWDKFFYGYTVESQKVTESLGQLQVPLGLIEQPVEHLVENFQVYIEEVSKHKSIALGPFITSMSLVAPPSPEEIALRVEDYAPGYKNEEVDSDEEEMSVEAA
ncbi:large ribosomal subunit protein uL1m-like isoform X1 [Physella acuta]|uniref:large ribosomal subunit protein uL1m-like isoform X1 n=1 Tax=Physella acuta TaxID=109671 RepID=UPI0027DC3C80|nr:large ribosomal subunit protein uL1m-like isoform X1 [Physella acuta]